MCQASKGSAALCKQGARTTKLSQCKFLVELKKHQNKKACQEDTNLKEFSLLNCLPCRHLYCVVKGFKGMKGTDINPRNLAEYNLGQLASLGDVPSLERGSIKVILNQILLFL